MEIKSRGELRSLDPKRLIDPQIPDDVADFFLVLGLFYNDLKSLYYYYTRVSDDYKEVAFNRLSADAGELGGMRSHLLRLIASTVFEFLQFMGKNRKISFTEEFRLVYNSLDADLKEQWDTIVQIAAGKTIKQNSDFSDALMLVRNNLAFHYFQSRKILRQGFIDCFFRDEKSLSNEQAYYSVGSKMQDVRFFYSDAAAQRAVASQAQKKSVEIEEYHQKLVALTEMLNFTIMRLLKRYLKQRPTR